MSIEPTAPAVEPSADPSVRVLTDRDYDEVSRRFEHHPPHPDQVERYQALREATKEFALIVMENAPNTRERSLALARLDEVLYHACAAIARNEHQPPRVDRRPSTIAARSKASRHASAGERPMPRQPASQGPRP